MDGAHTSLSHDVVPAFPKVHFVPAFLRHRQYDQINMTAYLRSLGEMREIYFEKRWYIVCVA
jgi:hypothetical protein